MSAIQQLPSPSTSAADASDRRSEPRHRVTSSIAALIGRGEGTLVDVSANGARIRHSAPVRLKSRVRISFEWQQQRFSAAAEVLASRVISLGGDGRGATTFESRLRFVDTDAGSRETLARMIDGLGDNDLRKWVANLRGWSGEQGEEAPANHAPVVAIRPAFIRWQQRFGRWEKKWTRNTEQPDDGFTVPATIDERELAMLCRMWERSDEPEREMLREMARASVESNL